MNLVYERTDRITVLEKVGSILADHPPLKGQNCNCELCQHASKVASVVRYSPKVAQILAKGEDMTTSEYNYLIQRGLEEDEIEEVAGVSSGNLDVETYQQLKKQGMSDRKIAQAFNMTTKKLWEWKVLNGLRPLRVNGLTKEKYNDRKNRGFKDAEIRTEFNINAINLTLWKNLNFTDDELKMINKKPGRKNA